METLKKRKDVNKEDCWDLTHIIKSQQEYQELVALVKDKCEEISCMKGHILDDASTLLKYLTLSEEEERAFARLHVYVKFNLDEDTSDNKRKEKYLEIEKLGNFVSLKESFVMSEFMERDLEYVLALMQEEEKLEKYRLYFERLYRQKERVLSEKEEEIITKALEAFGTPDDAFNSLDITDAKFKSIEEDRSEIPLHHYNYSVLLEHKSQDVRRQAFLNYHEFYRNHKNTFASLLRGNYQELEFVRDIRKYNRALEMALDEIKVPGVVYDNLIESVHQHIRINSNFQKLKAKMLGVSEYHLYDTYVPVVASPTKSYTKEDAIQLVKKALKPLGDDYLQHFQEVFDHHTVDFYPNEGKDNGAYQWGCFDTPSYVLLNFNGTFNSVSTLAHELGHAVHSMYSKENNLYIYYGYEIFLAEIASTVNETLLSEYMIGHAETREEKIYYLCEFLDKVKATIFRQTMFSEFEQIMSEKCQNKESLTEETFSNTYYELNQKYFEDSVILDDDIRYEEYRIPHLYRPFYVYQYATGLISAICIASSILEGEEHMREAYIDFLKSGCSMDVLDILKLVNVDLTTKVPFEKAFSYIEKKYECLEKLVKEGE